MQRRPFARETTLCLLAGVSLLVGASPPAASAALAPATAPAPAPAMDKTAPKIRGQKIIVMDDESADRPYVIDAAKKVARGYLGVGLTDLTPELRGHFGVPEDSGVMVSKVDAGSPADKAGIKVGDIVTSLDGKPVGTTFDMRQRIRAADDGAPATLEVWRNGKVQTFSAALEKRDRPEVDLAPLFLRKMDGDRMILRLDGEDLPDKLALPPPGAPRLRVQSLTGREAELEKRLKELEKRIHDLERQLGAAAPKAH